MAENPKPETELLRAAQKGSMEGFEQVLLLYEQRIFNYIYRMVSHRQDAEDLTQETFLKLYRNIASWNEQKGFKSWLYTIATHTVYDWLRKKRISPELLIVDDPGRPFETSEKVPTYNILEERWDMETALGQIPPMYRNVLLLYYQQDLTYQEMSEVLGIPLNTVKTHLRRARGALKKVFEKNYG